MGRQRQTHQYEAYESIYYKVWIDNKPLSSYEMSLVEEIVHEDNSHGSDLCSITLHDPDYAIIDNPAIMKSTPCKVDAGYVRRHRTWVDGYISAVDVDFPETGVPTITLHVMDKTYIMNRIERKVVYKNMSYNDIASQIAKKHGLKFKGDSSGEGGKIRDSVTQSYETDIQFLMNIASEIGFLVFFHPSDQTFYFRDKEKDFQHKVYDTYWYRKPPFDILSFRPRIIQADQQEEVEESDIDSKEKKTTKGKSKNG